MPQIQSAKQLVEEFKKSGEFDRLRRQLLTHFANSDEVGPLMSRVEEIAREKLSSDARLELKTREAAHSEVMQEMERYPIVERAVSNVAVFKDETLLSTIEEYTGNIFRGESNDNTELWNAQPSHGKRGGDDDDTSDDSDDDDVLDESDLLIVTTIEKDEISTSPNDTPTTHINGSRMEETAGTNGLQRGAMEASPSTEKTHLVMDMRQVVTPSMAQEANLSTPSVTSPRLSPSPPNDTITPRQEGKGNVASPPSRIPELPLAKAEKSDDRSVNSLPINNPSETDKEKFNQEDFRDDARIDGSTPEPGEVLAGSGASPQHKGQGIDMEVELSKIADDPARIEDTTLRGQSKVKLDIDGVSHITTQRRKPDSAMIESPSSTAALHTLHKGSNVSQPSPHDSRSRTRSLSYSPK